MAAIMTPEVSGLSDILLTDKRVGSKFRPRFWVKMLWDVLNTKS